MINLIELGAGEYVINHGYFGECAAVFIEPAPLPGDVGADASKSGLRRDTCADGGTVITFYNLASAAVFADQLNEARRRIGERRGIAPKPSDVLASILAVGERKCKTCGDLTTVKVEGDERACPDCQPAMAAEEACGRAAGC